MRTKVLTTSFVPEKFLDKLLHSMRYRQAIKYIKSGDIVCDLGCGREGSFLRHVEKAISKGFGFDLFIDKRFEDDKIRLQVLDLNDEIPLPDSSVDTVVTMALLEHLNNYEGFVREIGRILKSSGTLVLSTPTRFVDPIIKILGSVGLIDKEHTYHQRYFNTEQLIKLLENSGFTQVKVTKFQLGLNQLAVGVKQ